MSKKNKGEHPFNTGDDFLNLAKARGASVEKKGRFFRIHTPRGSTYVAGGKEKLDDQTISNLRKWFRLLGLMLIFVGTPLWYILTHYYIWITDTIALHIGG